MGMTEISSLSLLFLVWFGLEHADILFLKKGIWNCESETGSGRAGTTGTAGTLGGYLLGRVEGRRYIR